MCKGVGRWCRIEIPPLSPRRRKRVVGGYGLTATSVRVLYGQRIFLVRQNEDCAVPTPIPRRILTRFRPISRGGVLRPVLN